MAKRVFLSYSTVDSAVTHEVCAALEAAGIPCWMAPRDVGAGDYAEAILHGIEQADVMVVILSTASNGSVHVKNEVERATSKQKLLVTLRVEDTVPARRLELFLSSQQWVNAFAAPGRTRADGVSELVQMIEGYLNRGAERVPDSGPRAPAPDVKALTRMVYGQCWVGYDPTEFDPTCDPPRWPGVPSLRQDLQRIRAAGFSGVVTFSCRGTLASIPELAKEQGLAVIAGVWNPADEGERHAALQLRDWVDGYCLGHNNLGKAYQKDALCSAMQAVRAATGRPVTTSEEIRLYRDEDGLCGAGDWLFPDCHISLRHRPKGNPTVDVERNVQGYLSLAAESLKLAKRHDRPVMLKMVTFPWSGAEHASLEKQAEFFSSLLEEIRDPEFGLPGRVAVMANGAFDVPWKTCYPFYSWDSYTGLLGPGGEPRPAVREILERIDRTV